MTPSGIEPTTIRFVAQHHNHCATAVPIVVCGSVNYGKVVQFRSFQTKHALMCEIHEHDKITMLKHVLCSLMNMSDFFHMKVFNIVIIKKK